VSDRVRLVGVAITFENNLFIGSHSLPPLWSPNRSFINNISKCHDIRHVYIVSSLIETSFYHAIKIISKDMKLDTI
jgi:hypothetical protein